MHHDQICYKNYWTNNLWGIAFTKWIGTEILPVSCHTPLWRSESCLLFLTLCQSLTVRTVHSHKCQTYQIHCNKNVKKIKVKFIGLFVLSSLFCDWIMKGRSHTVHLLLDCNYLDLHFWTYTSKCTVWNLSNIGYKEKKGICFSNNLKRTLIINKKKKQKKTD